MDKLDKRVLNTLHVIRKLNASVTVDEVFNHLSSYGESLGFQTCSITPLMNPAMKDFEFKVIGRSSWPEEFLNNWIDSNYVFHDPISRYAMNNRTAFTWSDAYTQANKVGKRILDEASDFNLNEGVSIPVQCTGYPTGIISLSAAVVDLSPAEISELELVCIHAYSKLLKLGRISKYIAAQTLTPREVEILHYAAAGKTNWEIAKIHGISENSVKSHMKNITAKFEAGNRAHSVAIGITSGQIIP